MKTTVVTVQLPEDDAQFLETYAKEHAVSVAELFARYARRLQKAPGAPHPKNLQFTGSVPPDVDARAEHRQHGNGVMQRRFTIANRPPCS